MPSLTLFFAMMSPLQLLQGVVLAEIGLQPRTSLLISLAVQASFAQLLVAFARQITGCEVAMMHSHLFMQFGYFAGLLLGYQSHQVPRRLPPLLRTAHAAT